MWLMTMTTEDDDYDGYNDADDELVVVDVID